MMRKSLLGMCAMMAIAGVLLFSGCGQQPAAEQGAPLQPAKATPSAPVGGALSSAPSPQYAASATWANEIELVGFDVNGRSSQQSDVAIYYKCLKTPPADYYMTLHLLPTNKGVLTAGVPLAVASMGALLWDLPPSPPTSKWEPGKYYRVTRTGVVPAAGGTWAIEVGFYTASGGKVLSIVRRTDSGAKPKETNFRSDPLNLG